MFMWDGLQAYTIFSNSEVFTKGVRNACTKHYKLLVEYQFLLSSWGYSVHPADMTDDALPGVGLSVKEKKFNLNATLEG